MAADGDGGLARSGGPGGAGGFDPDGGQAAAFDRPGEAADEDLERAGVGRMVGRGGLAQGLAQVEFVDEHVHGQRAVPAVAPGQEGLDLATGKGPGREQVRQVRQVRQVG